MKILDEVRRGCVSEDSLNSLRGRVISGTVVEKFVELSISNMPVSHQRHVMTSIKKCFVL